jgi:hypothetical protein
MHPLKKKYYTSHYLATIQFVANGEFIVVGGKPEKRALTTAKRETCFCYVRDIQSRSEVRLDLVNDEWIWNINERSPALAAIGGYTPIRGCVGSK